jgi:hypothetical protein
MLQNIILNKIVFDISIHNWFFEAIKDIGKLFKNINNNTWEAGVYNFKILLLNKITKFNNIITKSSYNYNIIKNFYQL